MSEDYRIKSGPAVDPKNKPAKPYPEFPLFAHNNGTWAKKIRGKLHYFGIWADPDGALANYLAKKDHLHAGTTPAPDTRTLTVKDLANSFLNAKQKLLDNGEITLLTWRDYKIVSDELVANMGKNRLLRDLKADDFAWLRNQLAKKYGPHRLKKSIRYICSMFKHGYDSELLDRPMRFGPEFKPPTLKTFRLHRAAQGAKLFTREEILKMLDAAGTQLRAMILLGINCAYGNQDVGTLQADILALDRGLADYPRPKTGIPRRCPLWPETVQAIRATLAERPRAKKEEDAGLVFITKYGQAWAKDKNSGPLTQAFRKFLNALGIPGRRNFYVLRHTFRTVADEAKDQPAADYIMGHEVPHMSSHYREGISDERLKSVTDHVRAWLFGPQ